MSLENFFEIYGVWVGLGLYILVKDGIPFLTQRVWPERVKRNDFQMQTETEFRRRQYDMEDRQIKAMEGMSEAVKSMAESSNAMAKAITINNERLSNLIAGHAEHAAFTQQAVTEMKVVTAGMEKK